MNFKMFSFWDMALTKLAVFFATLFLVSAWEGFRSWIVDIDSVWFLVLAIILAIKPLASFFKK